jgi:hypothetical protein
MTLIEEARSGHGTVIGIAPGGRLEQLFTRPTPGVHAAASDGQRKRKPRI